MPDRASRMPLAILTSHGNAWLSVPLLLLMGTASHYYVAGKKEGRLQKPAFKALE